MRIACRIGPGSECKRARANSAPLLRRGPRYRTETSVAKGSHIFDKSLQTANLWPKTIEDPLECDDRDAAHAALRAVLHTLRDQLPLEAVLGLSAQSPILIRGLLLEGWRPQNAPSRLRDAKAFGEAVARRLPASIPLSGIEASTAVFGILGERLDAGDVRKIVAHLPEPLQCLWPDPGPVGTGVDPAHRPIRRRSDPQQTSRRSGVLAGPTIAMAGSALTSALLVSMVQSGSIDPAQVLLDPDLGRQRLVVGLLLTGVAVMLGAALAAVLIARRRHP
jgi:uncharacterized protein (DUF2267 family)